MDPQVFPYFHKKERKMYVSNFASGALFVIPKRKQKKDDSNVATDVTYGSIFKFV